MEINIKIVEEVDALGKAKSLIGRHPSLKKRSYNMKTKTVIALIVFLACTGICLCSCGDPQKVLEDYAVEGEWYQTTESEEDMLVLNFDNGYFSIVTADGELSDEGTYVVNGEQVFIYFTTDGIVDESPLVLSVVDYAGTKGLLADDSGVPDFCRTKEAALRAQ